jgi:Fe-S-cluster-containing dehydrogenase component
MSHENKNDSKTCPNENGSGLGSVEEVRSEIKSILYLAPLLTIDAGDEVEDVALLKFEPGDEILSPLNARGDKFYCIVSGSATSTSSLQVMEGSAGRELRIGDLFGLESALFGRSFEQVVIANTSDPVRVLEIHNRTVRSLRSNPDFDEMAIREAMRLTPAISDLLNTDLEWFIRGKKFNDKRTVPFCQLQDFQPGETIFRQGQAGVSSFYFLVSGDLEVLDQMGRRIGLLKPHDIFGLKSFIFETPRNATVKVIGRSPAFVLQFNRLGLSILRKISTFDDLYTAEYRTHGKALILDRLELAGLDRPSIELLDRISEFRLIATQEHLLCEEGSNVSSVYLISQGSVHRRKGSLETPDQEDYLNAGVWLGLDLANEASKWPYTITLMGPIEFLEVPIDRLRQEEIAARNLTTFFDSKNEEFVIAPQLGAAVEEFIQGRDEREKGMARDNVLAAQNQIIGAGIADATNLLVIDMSLCVQCGRCSLACHQIHGQSRLERRGLQIVRPTYANPAKLQTLLVPQTCIHCQGAMCLTHCPTGAISRLSDNTIDIDPSTCIGCGLCAIDCPYDAVKMVEETKQAGLQRKTINRLTESLMSSLGQLTAFGHKPMPRLVEGPLKELKADKCNLCRDCATLNPTGVPERYGCEEACPTGALIRVSPRQYFNETPEGRHLHKIDDTHFVGRNIHKKDKTKQVVHGLGMAMLGLLVASLVFGLVKYGLNERIPRITNLRWLTGWVGLGFLLIAGLYAVRRRIFKRRFVGQLRYWLLAHYYAGIACAALFYVHTGFGAGGAHTTLLLLVFDGTIGSGILALSLYKVIPRLITRLEDVPVLLDDLEAKRGELRQELESGLATLSDVDRRIIRERLLSPKFLLRQFSLDHSLSDAIRSSQKALGLDGVETAAVVEASVTLQRVQALIFLYRTLKYAFRVHGAITSLMLPVVVYHIYQVIHFG